uniref:Innexin n=1 Tax=Parastrongyloides trichosuri TaxID=131310 RepID=A0A0N4ZRW3_PARTI
MKRLPISDKKIIKSTNRLESLLADESNAVLMAQRATGFLVTLCFFALPLFWSNMIRQCVQGQDSIISSFQFFAGFCNGEIPFHSNDPWSVIRSL